MACIFRLSKVKNIDRKIRAGRMARFNEHTRQVALYRCISTNAWVNRSCTGSRGSAAWYFFANQPEGQRDGTATELMQLVALRIERHPVKDWDEHLAAAYCASDKVITPLLGNGYRLVTRAKTHALAAWVSAITCS
ncbi:hypothetical protein [Rhodoferax sp.]|uniref:hypothetical protein n=1 Tax=Rhodoferax sp. TaxID=50421 RepID=UPI00262CB37C|nr:hypothetical protein [Rhodoferax sp.]